MSLARLSLQALLAAVMIQAAAAETIPLPQRKPETGMHTDKPIENQLPQPATTAEPAPLPSVDSVNPDRFGAKPADAAYGAFQRGLYKTAYNLALVRAQNGDPAAQTLVAEILSRGLGVPLNSAEAAKWY
ncbi:sel1 repeat family protein, partial [Mesorhizobium sp. M00.F.Ca.ET.158.01.1.1]